jgi:hypothetical protein
MIGALLYLQVQSIRNRVRMRLRRLKKPKYLAGALVGAAYIYFFFFRNLLAGRRGPVPGAEPGSAETLMMLELLGALTLFAMVLAAWLFPHERAALAFTEAEMAFLFPAPVTRKTLIHFKLLRSQSAILFTTVLLTLVTRRFGGGGSGWIRATGWWMVLSTLNLHTLGASFARTRLLDHGVSNARRRILLVSILALVLGLAIWWAKTAIPAPEPSDFTSLKAIGQLLRRTLESGPAYWILFPFRLMVRPYLASETGPFLLALLPALALMLAHYFWVVRSDVAFEESSLALAQKRAEMIASVRAGNWHSTAGKKKKRPPFALAATGPPAIAFLWKNLISAGQVFNLRTWLFLAFLALCLGGPVGMGWQGQGFLLPTIGIITAVLGAYSLFLGPAILRLDLRQDLANADVLKMYPLHGWQVVLGELLTPTLILTGIQWCLVLLSVAMFSRTADGHAIGLANRLSIGAGAAIIAPMLNLISLVIPNASVLLFPAWMQIGREHAGGIEVMGQRLIFMLGSLVVFAFALVPAGSLLGLTLVLGKPVIGFNLALPVAALAAAAVLAGEASLAVWWMGRLFERFDVSSERSG